MLEDVIVDRHLDHVRCVNRRGQLLTSIFNIGRKNSALTYLLGVSPCVLHHDEAHQSLIHI
ncbi:hypothetical protein, partial [Pseudomonas sp. AH2 (2023)]|uniref:hypothetical protein n=1 Tax=Pseudomonas sp. AH2 (2023) TaxID=3048599 RepID=UPI002B23EDEC